MISTRGDAVLTQTFFIVTVQNAHLAAATNMPCAFFCYRISAAGTLQRTPLPRATKGGLLGILNAPSFNAASSSRLQKEIAQECQRRGYIGILFPQALPLDDPSLFSALCHALQQQGLHVFLMPELSKAIPGSHAILPGTLSGGTLEAMISDYVTHYGLDCVALYLQRCQHRFPIPCSTPHGYPITQEEVQHIRDTHHCQFFFSKELCTNYCTYYTQTEDWQFLLVDDVFSLTHRLRQAQTKGVPYCFLSYQEWSDEAKQIADALRKKEE